MDPRNSRLNAALYELQSAVEEIRQQSTSDSFLWKKRAQELEAENQELKRKLQESLMAQSQIRSEIDNLRISNEQLQDMNNTLQKALQEKDKTIQKYVAISQSMKGLLDPVISENSSDSYYKPEDVFPKPFKPQPQTDVYPRKQPQYYQPSPNPSSIKSMPTLSQTPRSVVQSPQSSNSVFLKAARQELSFSEFNEMINQISMYNKRDQTKEETLQNVRDLMLPKHQSLYDQFAPILNGA